MKKILSLVLVAAIALAGTVWVLSKCEETNSRFTAKAGDTVRHCETGQKLKIAELAPDSLLDGRVGEMQFSHRAPMIVPMQPTQCRLTYQGTTDDQNPRAILAFQCDEGSDTI